MLKLATRRRTTSGWLLAQRQLQQRRRAASRSTAALRSSFLNYFEKQAGHVVLPSSGLIPRNDPSLLFTTAGMVQFKDAFLGLRQPEYGCIATAQKCVRAGGKHNDLDNVGFTARHHTFFEMLGNFSFGSYWKKEAIGFAWQFLTREIGLPASRLSVTVLHGDDETADIWRTSIGLDSSKIRSCGPEDNFWAMGDGRGPCGPCTEIFFDQGRPVDGEQHLEIWNLVFMQYEKSDDGLLLSPLPTKCIDTGMGLERLASVVQGVESNWDTDVLAVLVNQTRLLLQQARFPTTLSVADERAALRVIADHVRAAAFLIAEGLHPGPQSRNYILRRILRRAVRYAHKLGLRQPLLANLVPSVVTLMGDAYPELKLAEKHIQSVVTHEETLFFATINRAMDLLTAEISATPEKGQISGDTAWGLYFHLGFPLDLTEIVSKEHGWTVDVEGFNKHLEQTRRLSRENWKGSGDHLVPPVVRSWTVKPKFVGYDVLATTSTIVASTPDPSEPGYYWVSVDPCPFYAEGGGQIGDVGSLEVKLGNNQVLCQVIDTQCPYLGGFALKVKAPSNMPCDTFSSVLEVGSTAAAVVDGKQRMNARRNHTATHLLHSALKVTLGDHVKQCGSRVEPDRLRFDFAHPAPLSELELNRVESMVNTAIQNSVAVSASEMDYHAAVQQKQATALFGAKYDKLERVRVVEVPGISVELCGGTHVSDTSQILLFKIVSQQAIGAGTRRIEALTGPAAVEYMIQHHQALLRAASIMKTDQIDQIPDKVKEVLDRHKHLEKQLKQLQTNVIRAAALQSTFRVSWEGSPLCIHVFAMNTDASVLRQKADDLRSGDPSVAHILICLDRIILTSSSTHAGKLLSRISTSLGHAVCKGGGGATIGEGKLFVESAEFIQLLSGRHKI